MLSFEHAEPLDVEHRQIEGIGDQELQSPLEVGLGGDDPLEPRQGVPDRIVQDHEQAVLLGIEVVVKRRRSDAHVSRDVGPLSVLVAVAAEARDGGGEDLISLRPFGAGPLLPRKPSGILSRTHISIEYHLRRRPPSVFGEAGRLRGLEAHREDRVRTRA